MEAGCRKLKGNPRKTTYSISLHSEAADDDDDSDDSNKEYYPPFVMPKKMTDFKWVLGAGFGTKDEFKETIINYAIYNARLKGLVWDF
ncbi:hypothetical protein MTR_6g072720 [Medicago truncatula]|uniref:Uncharacterized protein n=1 Tax=Medicago truncatula TaxID=3880 RepID=G7KIH3_MEDTR|nr:hypothetical protein MTR_6g072720 [Medicago truncatula]